jgi:hypothetical protein
MLKTNRVSVRLESLRNICDLSAHVLPLSCPASSARLSKICPAVCGGAPRSHCRAAYQARDLGRELRRLDPFANYFFQPSLHILDTLTHHKISVGDTFSTSLLKQMLNKKQNSLIV